MSYLTAFAPAIKSQAVSLGVGTAIQGYFYGDGETQIEGLQELFISMTKFLVRMEMKAREVDRSALDQMVQLAKSRAPRDTGRLVNGITGEQQGDICEFRASAVNESKPNSQEDYARMVEFGTHAGQRGQFHEIVADEGFYTAPATLSGEARGVARLQRRRSLRGHPGTDPQPFFFNSVEDVLGRRPQQMQHALEDAGRSEGFL